MIYVTSFFKRFYPNHTQIEHSELETITECDSVAIDIMHNDIDKCSDTVRHLVKVSGSVHVYLGEPTEIFEVNEIKTPMVDFLKEFNQPNIHFYSDCVLNFTQHNYTPMVNWFIDPLNYYSEYKWAKNLLIKLEYHYDKPYKFDILLGQQRGDRDYIDSLFENSRAKEQSIYSYFKDSMSKGVMWDGNIDTTQHQITSELFKINGEDARPSAIIPVEIYNKSYYSVVCETTAYVNSYNHYTEKVAKPMLALRPFVAFAGQHYMKNLRSLGFKTFSTVLDEGYDSVAEHQLRHQLAVKQVEWLCEQDPETVLTELDSILEHNRNHFLTVDWASAVKDLF
jgi:hypothetical protein